MSYARPYRDPWGYVWLDDCPPPPRVVRIAPAPPPARERLVVELPPCKPQGGVNTDWSGNKCATRYGEQIADRAASPQRVVLTPPQTGPEAPKLEQPAPQVRADVGTVGQEPASGGEHASMFSGIGFYLAVALILALAFVLVRGLVRFIG
jgi:hypothetical protein